MVLDGWLLLMIFTEWCWSQITFWAWQCGPGCRNPSSEAPAPACRPSPPSSPPSLPHLLASFLKWFPVEAADTVGWSTVFNVVVNFCNIMLSAKTFYVEGNPLMPNILGRSGGQPKRSAWLLFPSFLALGVFKGFFLGLASCRYYLRAFHVHASYF